MVSFSPADMLGKHQEPLRSQMATATPSHDNTSWVRTWSTLDFNDVGSCASSQSAAELLNSSLIGFGMVPGACWQILFKDLLIL